MKVKCPDKYLLYDRMRIWLRPADLTDRENYLKMSAAARGIPRELICEKCCGVGRNVIPRTSPGACQEIVCSSCDGWKLAAIPRCEMNND